MPRSFLLVLALIAFAGCEKVGRYPAAPAAKAAKEKPETKAIWGWMFPDEPPQDLPLRFVAADRPEWRSLPKFWNEFPISPSGPATSHLGQTPLGIAAGFALLDGLSSIAIKVPRGLPDPTPLIPTANPPTLAKWRLGKKIFFAPVLSVGKSSLACADCHQPKHGFAETSAVSTEGTRNTLSLINVAYNREQFWDGRVQSLEEVLVHSPGDELQADTRLKTLELHRFGGVAKRIDQDETYRTEFRAVFGVGRITQDAVAKVLATYMRTILSGNSLYDRAQGSQTQPSTADFKRALTGEASKELLTAMPGATAEQLVDRLVRGQSIFFGKGGCVLCHPPGLFTDHRFHNTQVGDSGVSQAVSGRETGRFSILPIGLKDPLLRGAYRTPTLRNLPATAPYFHNGGRSTLDTAIDHYGKHLDKDNRLLAEPLRDMLARTPPAFPAGARPMLFDLDDGAALGLFLLALDGQPVDPKVANP